MAPSDITLKFVFPTTPGSDMRTFKIYRLGEPSDAMTELYRFHHPATGLLTGSTTFRRQNMSTNVFETAGQIDWLSNHNATVQFGLEEAHIRDLRRVKKSGSQSRRFKAGGSEYKWKIADESDLLCVDSRGKVIATWTREEQTLHVSSKMESLLDRVVVTCFLNLASQEQAIWRKCSNTTKLLVSDNDSGDEYNTGDFRRSETFRNIPWSGFCVFYYTRGNGFPLDLSKETSINVCPGLCDDRIL